MTEEVVPHPADTVQFDPASNGHKPEPEPGSSKTLRLWSIAEIRAELERQGERTWLIQGIWPSDAYGVLGAQDKAGKTWAVGDLAVSVASGTPWFGRFECPTPGPVVLFLGEGGMAGTVRRLDAICAHKGVRLDDLPIYLEFKVPNLTRAEHLATIAQLLGDVRPKLVALDPLYLSVGGRSGSNLAEMGEVLSGPQAICSDLGAALIVVSHWNKGGEGRGVERFTGVGPGAWGRVLGSAAVDQAETDQDTKKTTVTLAWSFKGGEIPDTEFRTCRQVWAEDPEDINSALNYAIELTSEGPTAEQPGGQLGMGRKRVLGALHAGGAQQTVGQLQEATAHDGQGKPLMKKTVQNTLTALEKVSLVEGTEPLPGYDRRWSITASGLVAIGADK